MHVFIDDQWVSDSEASINIKDIGVLRGFGIFDYLRTYGKHPFRLADHIDRFYNSARILGMKQKYSKERLTEIMHEGIERNGFAHTNIKFIQTGGISEDGFTPAPMGTFFAYFYEGGDLDSKLYEHGLSLITSPLMRQVPEAKTINYAASIVAVSDAMKHGASDILHTDTDGNIYEATRSNFFGVRDGVLVTTADGVLFGITRKVVLELAEKLHIPVDFRFVHISEIDKLDEAFITNSSQEVMPVTTINGKQIGDGNVGGITKRLYQAFQDVKTG